MKQKHLSLENVEESIPNNILKTEGSEFCGTVNKNLISQEIVLSAFLTNQSLQYSQKCSGQKMQMHYEMIFLEG